MLIEETQQPISKFCIRFFLSNSHRHGRYTRSALLRSSLTNVATYFRVERKKNQRTL